MPYTTFSMAGRSQRSSGHLCPEYTRCDQVLPIRDHHRCTDGNDFLAAGFPIRPGTHMVCHVPRRTFAQTFFALHPIFKLRTGPPGLRALLVGFPAGSWILARRPIFPTSGRCSHSCLVLVAVILPAQAQPDRPRAFRAPVVPLFPLISVVLCLSPDVRSAGVNMDPVLPLAGSWPGDLLFL